MIKKILFAILLFLNFENFNFQTINNSTSGTIDLKVLVQRLEEYAPLSTAIDWDNVGLLVEPSGFLAISKVLITNDLTEAVLDEALAKKVNLIISYHPAIHPYIDKPLRRLTQAEWKQRSIVKCIENRIAVYSPHTTWDSIDGGINDLILEAFDAVDVESVKETKSTTTPTGYSQTIKINLNQAQHRENILDEINHDIKNIKFIGAREIIDGKNSTATELEFLASQQGVVSFIESAKSVYGTEILSTLRIYELNKPILKNVGLGRIGHLKEPLKIKQIVEKLKSMLGMKSMRIALANGKTLDDQVKVLAVGAGTSSGLLNNVNADLIITGEMSHHEVLHEVHRGVSLIVTDHSYTERPFISAFIKRFGVFLKKHNDSEIELIKSEADRDPLEYI